MRVLFRKPMNQPLELIELENTVDAIHDKLGGYFQVITIRPDILCLCDEDGLAKDLKPNYYNDFYGQIVGNVIFCARDGMEFNSLTDEQIKFVEEYIGFPIVDNTKTNQGE